MEKGKFAASIEESIELLKKFSLFKGSQSGNFKTFSQEYMSVSRSGDYLKIYNTVTHNYDYTILLKDDSFFQFHIEGNNGGYIFMQNPYRTIDFETFAKDQLGMQNLSETEIWIARELYEQFLQNPAINTNAVYMRMDFDENTYHNFIHSLAHLHINIDSSIRIPFDKILSPLAFCAFVLKHVYYNLWKEGEKKDYLDKYKTKLRESLCEHPKEFWSDEDKLNLFMT